MSGNIDETGGGQVTNQPKPFSPALQIPSLNSSTVQGGAETWTLFGRPTQQSKIRYIAQTVLIYFIVIYSVVTISIGTEQLNLWTVLLSSSLGYLLPSPTLKGKKNG